MSKARVRALRSVELGFSNVGSSLRFFTEVWNLTMWGKSPACIICARPAPSTTS